MKNRCKSCEYWDSPHDGYWDGEKFGTCKLLNSTEGAQKIANYAGVYGLVEGCVNVQDRTDDFEFVTGESFGCIHFERR